MACTKEEDNAVWHELGSQMQGSTGVNIADRTYGFRTYRSCFVGSSAVDWMLENQYAKTREEAVSLGMQLVQNDVFHHVSYAHTFKDGHYFYRFPEDDPLKKRIKLGGPSVASLLSDCGVTKAGYILRKGALFWNKRFLMVKQDEGKLFYFNSDLEPAPKFVVDLADGIRVKEEHGAKKKAFCFTISSPNSSITFACTTKDEQEEWMNTLVDAGIDLNEESTIGFSQNSIYDFLCHDINGGILALSAFKDKVCLIVNVASK